MSNFISLPKDMMIEILDKLPIETLINLLSTNKYLYKYLPIFSSKIEDYREDLKYQREIAGPKYIERIEKIQNAVQDIMQEEEETGLLFLDDQLVQIMNLEHMSRINNRIVYAHSGIIRWWLVYVIDKQLVNLPVRSQTDLTSLNVTVDDFIANLVRLPLGSNISFYNLSLLIFDQYTELVNIPIPVKILYEIGVEINELYDIVSRYGINI